MKVIEESDGSITVTSVTWWPALAALAFGAGAVAIWLRDPPRRGDAFWSALIALAALACLAGLERGRFRFDRADGRLTWTRRRLFRREGGELPFSAIHAISLEQAFDIDNTRRSNARRIDLHTTAGLLLMTTGYSGSVETQRLVAARIRQVLGLESAVVQSPRSSRGQSR